MGSLRDSIFRPLYLAGTHVEQSLRFIRYSLAGTLMYVVCYYVKLCGESNDAKAKFIMQSSQTQVLGWKYNEMVNV